EVQGDSRARAAHACVTICLRVEEGPGGPWQGIPSTLSLRAMDSNRLHGAVSAACHCWGAWSGAMSSFIESIVQDATLCNTLPLKLISGKLQVKTTDRIIGEHA